MNILDLIICIVLIIFAISGLRKGLIVEVFNLASYLIGVYGAMYFSEIVSNSLSKALHVSPEYLMMIAFILTFIVFVIVVRYLAALLSNLIEAINLGLFDKIGGLVFGGLKGALIVSLCIMALNIFGSGEVVDKELREQSLLYTRTENIANVIYNNQELVKDSMKKSFDKGKNIFDDSVDKIEDIIEKI